MPGHIGSAILSYFINFERDARIFGSVAMIAVTCTGLKTIFWFFTRGKQREFYATYQYGAPEEIRTPDLLVRSQILYPTELRARCAGGERGIRTLDEILSHTPLAGERLRPLGHLSGHGAKVYHQSCVRQSL
jgi:hypothetical protein